MQRPTSPEGKVKVNFIAPGILWATLYDFDFDDMALGNNPSKLKSNHSALLETMVVPLLADHRGYVWITGSASRIGNAGYNVRLSEQRESRVENFLLFRGIKPEQIQAKAIGESWAESHRHGMDDDMDRAVEVYVTPAPIDPHQFRPITRSIPLRPKVSRHFKIALTAGISASIAATIPKFASKVPRPQPGIALDWLYFLIWDTTNKLACEYLYAAPGIGIGMTSLPLPSISGTTPGPWNEFTTEKAMMVEQFGREAHFGSVSIPQTNFVGGLISWSHIHIETPRGINDVSMWINTGTTIGLGASQTVGDLYKTDGPFPYNGG